MWDHQEEGPSPSGVVLLVELLPDEVRDVIEVLPVVVLFEGLLGAVDGVLLHLLGHVGVLPDDELAPWADDELALTHLGGRRTEDGGRTDEVKINFQDKAAQLM